MPDQTHHASHTLSCPVPAENRCARISRHEPHACTAIQWKNILCVEDNIHNAALLRELLQGTGALTMVAENGAEAIRLVQKHTFDLVLMDLRMPDLDGPETLVCIRNMD